VGEAVQQLLSFMDEDDVLAEHVSPEERARLQLQGVSERLDELRGSIRVLDHRASQLGIDSVKSLDDVVPLLFAHSVYKSYPESFIAKGQWDRLSLWFDTVSTPPITDIDISGVADIDDWLERIEQSGSLPIASSGTSGKGSFLLIDAEDVELHQRFTRRGVGFLPPTRFESRRPVVLLGPSNAAMRYSHAFRQFCETFGRQGALYSLTDERMRMADAIRVAAIRRAMGDGTATPSDVAEFEQRAEATANRNVGAIENLAHAIFNHRDEPQFLLGPWAVWWRVMEIGHAEGVPDGSFHPDTAVRVAGGRKGLALPDDYREQMDRFLGDVVRLDGYGMSELSTSLPKCEAGVFHPQPWMILFALDESGEHMLEPGEDSRVRGRVGIFDIANHGHWGGIVSGDQATIDFSVYCRCGRPGPTVEDSVVRYSELSAGGDDKLTCSGMIEAYIRGAVTE